MAIKIGLAVVLAALLGMGGSWLWWHPIAPTALGNAPVANSTPAPASIDPAPVVTPSDASPRFDLRLAWNLAAVPAATAPAGAANHQTPNRPDAAKAKQIPSKASSETEPRSKARNTELAAATPAVLVEPVAPPEPNALNVPVQMPETGAAPLGHKQVKEFTPKQRAENEYRRAVLLIQQGKKDEALTELNQVLQLDAAHVGARQAVAALLVEAKRSDEALQKLQEGLKLDSTQAGLAMMLARLQVDRGDLHVAIDTLQRTLPYAANRADYEAFLAALLQRDARHKEAIEHYLAALRKLPQNGSWWMGLGISLQAENRSAQARDAFSKAKASNTLTPELQAFVEQKLGQM